MVNISGRSDFYGPELSVSFINDAVMMEGRHCVPEQLWFMLGKSAAASLVGDATALIRTTAVKQIPNGI